MLNELLKKIVMTTDLNEKIRIGKSLTALRADVISAADAETLNTLKSPGRPAGFTVVPPREVPKRNFQDLESRLNFLHAIANIELLAVELPALCLMRFGSDDVAFVSDQMRIIAEEAYHFELLKDRLADFGCEFGSLPVHHGLWDHAWRCDSELEHQILIPCYLEARGLDVTPEFARKFETLGDQRTARIMRLILTEEISHVRQGMRYLAIKAAERNESADHVFEKTLRGFFGDKLKSKIPLHHENRALAGFTPNQINLLAS